MKTKSFLKVCMALPIALLLMSHSVWMESAYKGVEGDEVLFNLYFGEFENDRREQDEAINSMGDFKALFIHENKPPVPVSLEKTKESIQGRFTAARSGFYQILAINDEREVQDWTKHGLTVLRPIEYQRSSFTAFSQKKTEKITIAPYFYIDIIPDYTLNHKGEVCSIFSKGQVVTGKIFLNNRLYPNADLQIYEPNKKVQRIKSDPLGNFSFTPARNGAFVLTSSLNDSTAGTFKGKEYKMKRYHTSTTIYVE